MADSPDSSQQTVNTLKQAAIWGLGTAAVVALAPLTLPTAAVLGIGAATATALGVSLPMLGAVVGGVIGYNKKTQ